MVTTKRISTGNGWRYMVDGKFASKAQYDRARKKKSKSRSRSSSRSTKRSTGDTRKRTMSKSIPIVGVAAAGYALSQVLTPRGAGSSALENLLVGDIQNAGKKAGQALARPSGQNIAKGAAALAGYGLLRGAVGGSKSRVAIGPLALRL